MTIKKIWKRICCLFHDDRTRLHDGERIEDWEEVQRKRREMEAEKQKEGSHHNVADLIFLYFAKSILEITLLFLFCAENFGGAGA